MKKFLMAAGAGALLVGAQAAVSAAYNPLDRADTASKDVVSARVVPTATTAGREYTAFADRPVRFDAAPDEVNTARPESGPVIADRLSAKPGPDTRGREPVVADHVSAEPTSYNSLISEATTDSPRENYSRYWGCYFRGSCGDYGISPGVGVGLGVAAVAIAVASDDGESD